MVKTVIIVALFALLGQHAVSASLESFCASDPCGHGGTCSEDDDFSNPKCDCVPGWGGETCRLSSVSCDFSDPCGNGGTCSTDDDGSNAVCDCLPGYSGIFCNIVPVCTPECENGGTCTDEGPSEPSCECLPGYSGNYCEMDQHYEPEDGGACNSNPCQQGGECVPFKTEAKAKYYCTCPAGTSGYDCAEGEPLPASCYRCQYIKVDNQIAAAPLLKGLEAIGVTSEETCKTTVSSHSSSACTAPGASCGTVQTQLSLAVELGGQALAIKMDVFSRDCFPDVDNPGVDIDDVKTGCHDAKKFDDFFKQRFLGAIASIPAIEADLTAEEGCICFCEGDACNDKASLTEGACDISGSGGVFVSLVLLTAALLAACRW